MSKHRTGECAYCGRISRIHMDHVPPKALFAKPLPRQLITVPACFDCNNGASRDDDYFVTRMALEQDAYGHPRARAQADALFRNLTRRKAAGFRRAFLDSLTDIDAYTPGGIFVGRRRELTVDSERIIRTVTRCAYGLYRHHFSRRIPNDRKVRAWALYAQSPAELDSIAYLISAVEQADLHEIGEGAFRYKIRLAMDESDCGAMLMQFYCAKQFMVAIAPQLTN